MYICIPFDQFHCDYAQISESRYLSRTGGEQISVTDNEH